LPPKPTIELKINLVPDAKPGSDRYTNFQPLDLKEVKTQIEDLLEKGVIHPSTSPWGSSILCVLKKNGVLRMCVDYMALNKATLRNNDLLPRIRQVKFRAKLVVPDFSHLLI
jgi:hypothetical protein